MADTKITALAAITTVAPANDLFAIVDVSDNSMAASGTTKNITTNQILGAGGTATLASATITGDLTVDTSTLKVDSANNTVGIGNASPPVGVSNSDTGLAVGAAGTVRSVLLGMQNCFGRIRERDAVNNLAITTNIGATGTLDDNTRSSWKIRIGSGNDNYVLQRAAIGSSTFQDLMGIDSGGVCVWSDGAGGTRMTLNSTGLGIGGSPATGVKLHVGGGNAHIRNAAGGQTKLIFGTSVNSVEMAGVIYDDTDGSVTFGTIQNYATRFITNNTYCGSFDASGNLLVGATSAGTNSGLGFKAVQTVAGHFDPLVVTSANSSIYSCWDIYSTGGTAGYRFYVTSTGTINAVNTTISGISDARLKENVQDLDVGLNSILALKPRKFDWKEGKGKNIKGDRGFIAQEFETVFPDLIDEWKDEAPEGEAPYKSVRADLIPVLVKAIQELAARVQTLEAK